MYVSPIVLPRSAAYTFLLLTVFGLPTDVVAASLGIDPSKVQEISDSVGAPLCVAFPIIT